MEPLAIRKKACLLLALLLTLSIPAAALAAVTTEVVVNRSVLLNLHAKSERVSIASPEIAELVVISPTQFQIIGKRVGSTTLIVWEQGGKTTFFDIRVRRDVSDLERQIEMLQDQIREISPKDDIRVYYANDTIVLSGKAANEQTVAKAVELAQAYAAKGEGSEKNTPAADLPLKTSRSSSYQMAAPGSDDKDAGGGAKAVTVLNHVEINEPQQVLLEVKVAQLDKTALKSLGISAFVRGNSAEGFSNLVGAPVGQLTIRNPDGSIRSQATGIAGPIPGLANITPIDGFQLGVSSFSAGIGAVLKALVTKNLAKVLAEPNLMVQSGQVGYFLAGSKIPYAVVSGVGALSTTSIEYKDVGVRLNFKPEVLENGLISLRIEPAEVSNITGTYVDGYPIIESREVSTRVKLREGESLVLAGLLQEEAIKAMSKIPMLGDIPILGALFRSTQDDIREKELVFFITPRLVTANAPGAEVTLPTDRPLTPEQEKEFQWIPLPK